MELRKDEQITLNIDGFIISQNIHNTNTAQSLFGIKNKNNLNIGHDDRTWVLEQDIICDTCNRCVSCQTCNSCDGCVSSVGCNDRCQGCTGSCTGCASGCYESCFGDCYTCQDCQAGCTSCDSCTAGCDGGCQTECYACVNCDGCVGCDNITIRICDTDCETSEYNKEIKCKTCTICAGCYSNCDGKCVAYCVGCDNETICIGCTGCDSACQASCNACVGCTGGCQGPCQVCVGCTGSCQAGCQTGCQTGCTGLCQSCDGGCNGSCNSGCTSCTTCVGCNGCDGCTGCTGCNGCVGCDSCTGCDGGCQNTVCGACTTGCTSGCQTGCTTGNYCYSNQCGSNTGPCDGNTGPEHEETKVWKTYCIGTNTGGYKAGINNSCTGGGDDGAHSDCPPEWLEEGHTEEEWNNLDYDSQKDFATEHGYEEENHDPPADFVSTSLEDILDNDAELAKKVKEGTKLAVKTDCDPETGKITQTIVDKETGEVLRTVEVKEDGSFEYQKPDGSTTLEDVKTSENGEIESGTGNGEDGKKTDLSDGSTTMTDPNSGKDVSVPPQGAGC